MGEIDEALREFLIESHEGLDLIERILCAGDDRLCGHDTVVQIFRVVHTIKGTCGFLGLSRLEKVSHAGEFLLCGLRDDRVAWTAHVTDALLSLSDRLRRILRGIESTGVEEAGDDGDLIALLDELAQADESTGSTTEKLPSLAPAAESRPPEVLDIAPPPPWEQLLADTARPAAVECQLTNDDVSQSVQAGSIRVDVGLLDRLMNLVGELVLTRNQILQHATMQQDAALLSTSQRLNVITSELQEGVMRSRMRPIGNVWDTVPRMVRDLARTCRKEVRVEIEGRETELDRTLLEAIKDPLVHLIRNAVDHGIESPQVRAERGKPPTGFLRLMARHESGQINIEVVDDGAGIDIDRIVEKAVSGNLVTREQVARMDAHERLHLIFLPGLSTAKEITTISGRGVGMDVVRANIERIGGTVDVLTQVGRGTTFRIRIPLTLAIIPALTVTCRGDRYAIPQVNLLELVRLEPGRSSHAIEEIQGTPVYRLRGTLLPLVHLDRTLGFTESHGHVNIIQAEAMQRIKKAHIHWLNRLTRMLEGQEAINVSEVASSTECELGRWILSEEQHLARHPEFETMRGIHALFHNTVKQTVESKLAGRIMEAGASYANVVEQSRSLTSVLDALAARECQQESIGIVVLQADGRRFGLVVDEIDDTQEIVVKPLGKYLKNVNRFAGATILGDGRVALILDVAAIAQEAHVSVALRERITRSEATTQVVARRAFLLFRQSSDRRMAVPLEQVARLEVIDRELIEHSSEGEVVQYRGDILPIVRYSDVHGYHGTGPEEGSTMQVLVSSRNGRRVGLVVDEILDIVEENPSLKPAPDCGSRPGLIGSAVIGSRVTDLIDLDRLMEAAFPLITTTPGEGIPHE